jgi:aquaporin Z
MMKSTSALLAEAIGTFWLVLGGCGTAVLAGSGVGTLGISLAFGLTVLTAAYAVGHISGGHFNPAVTVGLWAGGRFSSEKILPYIIAQVLGAVIASAVIYLIATGKAGYDGGLASNGVAEHSPGKYSMGAGILAEVVLTAMFIFVIMGATDSRAPAGLAPIAIGLALTLIHLISIPVTNTSVNPARSTGPAVLEGGIAFKQLLIFWIAPLVGGIIGGWLYKSVVGADSVED